MVLKLKPHIERHGKGKGCHLDRFEATPDRALRPEGEGLVGTLCISRQPIYAGARKLLELGVDPAAEMCGEHEHGTRTMFGTVGEHAKWTVGEPDRKGLTKREWEPFEGLAA